MAFKNPGSHLIQGYLRLDSDPLRKLQIEAGLYGVRIYLAMFLFWALVIFL